MRIMGILAIVALGWFGQPAFAHAAADFAADAGQSLAEAAAGIDWAVFNFRLKLVLVLLIMAAIASLSHLANRARQHGDLVTVRAR